MRRRVGWWLLAVVVAASAAAIAVGYRSAPELQRADDSFLDSATEQKLLLDQLRSRLARYHAVHGSWPRDLDIALRDSALGPPDRNLRVDVWGGTVRYRELAAGYELRALGPDRVAETGDDIVVTDQNPPAGPGAAP